MGLPLYVLCVARKHLLVSRQMRLQLLPDYVIALLLLEVDCRNKRTLSYPAEEGPECPVMQGLWA
jgi:hypothetical protein